MTFSNDFLTSIKIILPFLRIALILSILICKMFFMKNINEITQWALGEYKKNDVYVGHGTESAEDEILFLKEV